MKEITAALADRVQSDKAAAIGAYVQNRPLSQAAHTRACVVLPGGNTRSVLHFDPFPFRVVSAEGAILTDLDGHQYIDFCGNYTASLIGNRPTSVRKAIESVLESGWAVGATNEQEVQLAELLCARFVSLENVRFTNSGTEANLMAIATAIHVTGRGGVGAFDHGYHGGVLSMGDVNGPHHPLNVPHEFHVAPFNDIDALDDLFKNDLACVIVEAVQGSGGCRVASTEFLHEVRRRCTESGALMILDEVMTSRLSPGGAQELFGVLPDMTTLGKYIGGGLSFGAFGGSRDVMRAFDPAAGGLLTQAGTFNNNVFSIAAAVAVLTHELSDARLRRANELGDQLRQSLNDVFATVANSALWVTGLGSMLCVHATDRHLHELYFHTMLAAGFYPARRGFIALSFDNTRAHIDGFVEATRQWTQTLFGR